MDNFFEVLLEHEIFNSCNIFVVVVGRCCDSLNVAVEVKVRVDEFWSLARGIQDEQCL